ncbi:MAG: metallophosphoesterase [Acidobacteriia bacterium]|nr:metallophosphoesterase [Terriglobia bacterium]
MKSSLNRRSFMKVAGASLGVGAMYRIVPTWGKDKEGQEMARLLGKANGESVSPFSFVQLSDTHVGFSGPPDPLGTKAFELAVEKVNQLPEKPELVLFTGDLTHDSENPEEHANRMRLFQKISSRLNVAKIKHVPGEHDAGLDGGKLFHEFFGESSYSFDHRGIHFIALDNVSRARPEVGEEQRAWLKKDVARFSKSSPMVVFTHRPLFDLKPEWEWFTSDGDEVMNVLAPYENVTVLYGHIHRQNSQKLGNATHYAARSLIFAFPDPESGAEKKPIPFDKDQPFKNLGIRQITGKQDQVPSSVSLSINDVELSVREFAGTAGIQQFSKKGVSL